MNKIISFVVSQIITVGIYLWILSRGATKLIDIDVYSINPTPILIFWYMVWKLLHDKSKDE